jgi:hypothetical protein
MSRWRLALLWELADNDSRNFSAPPGFNLGEETSSKYREYKPMTKLFWMTRLMLPIALCGLSWNMSRADATSRPQSGPAGLEAYLKQETQHRHIPAVSNHSDLHA